MTDDRLLRLRRVDPGRGEPEIADIAADLPAIRRRGDQPRLDYPPYRSSLLRHPTKDLHHADPEGVELWAPCFGARDVGPLEADLTIQHGGEPIGERIVVTGRVVDGDGRPVAGQLVEIWQANAAAATSTSATSTRRRSTRTSPASAAASPTTTAATGSPPSSPARTRGATTATPGGRRTSTSRCSAPSSPSGWSPRCTSRRPAVRARPDLPVDHRPAGPRPAGRDVRPRRDQHEWATGYRWDIVLTGSQARHPGGRRRRHDLVPTPGQTVGPFFEYALPFDRDDNELVPPGTRPRIRLHGRVTDGAGRAGVPDALLEIRQADADGRALPREGRCAATAGRSPAGARATDAEGTTAFTTVRARRTRPGRRRRSSRSPSSRAAAEPAVHPGLPARRRGPPGRRPAAGRLDDAGARRWSPARRPRVPVFDIRLQGEGETVFLRYPGQ